MKSKKCLSSTEISKIVQLLAQGASTLEISKSLGRDHRTIKTMLLAVKNLIEIFEKSARTSLAKKNTRN